ncbi:GNAT family N-acetyltransferase [Streptomyces sp. LP05-1]|uniref:GNAT family N-acetyltransferase n=1 Tax=Streptomyces pyxinae TaxID=2970734 RepID=A0ABT2CMY2_9ACTN|nr:GNAT family N-acetyltransferase [Streptomyces sp. LP05-1]MCS0638071.1 GNAT family N-acetyltransferase [Streptomyces sp. LP05-1]
MTTEMRVLRPEEWDSWYPTLELAFGGVAESPEERELWKHLTEPERSIGVWDGDTCVGTSGAFTLRLSVPGGDLVPTAGVTMVGVAPTHRRRGILTSMMRRLLADARAAGEPVAALTASEQAIYGRFGYGIASQELSARIPVHRVRLTVPDGADEVSLRLVEPAKAGAAVEEVYAAMVAGRPGMLARRPGWERLPLLDPPGEREGASPLMCVLAERAGRPVGFALYAVKPEWGQAGADGQAILYDLGYRDPAAYGALFRYLWELDLISSLALHRRPLDDPWQYLVSDARRCLPTLRDALHVRLVDVGAALAARAYQAPVDVVLEVADAFCPWNAGRWRLTGDAGGAVCVRTEDPAGLALSVRELGAAYLGGVPLAGLAAAGRVRELRPGALAEASAAFGWPVAPWLPHGF